MFFLVEHLEVALQNQWETARAANAGKVEKIDLDFKLKKKKKKKNINK